MLFQVLFAWYDYVFLVSTKISEHINLPRIDFPNDYKKLVLGWIFCYLNLSTQYFLIAHQKAILLCSHPALISLLTNNLNNISSQLGNNYRRIYSSWTSNHFVVFQFLYLQAWNLICTSIPHITFSDVVTANFAIT